MTQLFFRLSEWGPTMKHGEPGQVGNQAALNHLFHVSDSVLADEFLEVFSFFLKKYCSKQ